MSALTLEMIVDHGTRRKGVMMLRLDFVANAPYPSVANATKSEPRRNAGHAKVRLQRANLWLFGPRRPLEWGDEMGDGGNRSRTAGGVTGTGGFFIYGNRQPNHPVGEERPWSGVDYGYFCR